jgi:hypothetical protein
VPGASKLYLGVYGEDFRSISYGKAHKYAELGRITYKTLIIVGGS